MAFVVDHDFLASLFISCRILAKVLLIANNWSYTF